MWLLVLIKETLITLIYYVTYQAVIQIWLVLQIIVSKETIDVLLGSFQNNFTSDVSIFGDAANFLDVSKPCYFLTQWLKYQPKVSNKAMSNVRRINFSVFISTLNRLAGIVDIKICPNSTMKFCSNFTGKITRLKRSGIFIFNFEQISHIVLELFLLIWACFLLFIDVKRYLEFYLFDLFKIGQK